MTEQDDDVDISKWPTISAEELAASRREAIRERLAAGPKDWLNDFIIAMRDVLQSQSVDDALNAAERERAEANLETLRNQAPALIHLLEGLPSTSRDGAFSIVFNLLAAVRSPIASTRAQLGEQSRDALEAAVQTKIAEVSPASQLIADDVVKAVQKTQAAKGTEANSAKAARKQTIAARHAHVISIEEALPLVNADLRRFGYEPISSKTLRRWRAEAVKSAHS